jgi:multidrug resistance efflux pump
MKKNKRSSEKTEINLLVEHLEKDLNTELHKIKWFSKEISEAKAKVAQTRKVLEKLRKIK